MSGAKTDAGVDASDARQNADDIAETEPAGGHMRVIGAWVGAVLLVCACAPLDDAFQETGQGGLTGCLQAPDGQVEGVTVWVRGRPERRQTDSNGCFNFDALPVGLHPVPAN